MGYLLDTNVLSETRKTRPDPGVLAFLEESDAARLFVSVLVVGELRKGVETKRRSDPDGAERIAAWVDGMETTFADRILPVDVATATCWGMLSADRPRPVVDTLLAATALVHDLTLVTRNTHDARGLDVRAIDPWREQA